MSKTQPSELDGDLVRSPDESTQNGPGRAIAVRIMFPGHADPSLRLGKAIPLDGICDRIHNEISAVDSVELMSTPGEIQQEYLFTVYTTDRNHERATDQALGDGPGITEWDGADDAPAPSGRSVGSIAREMQRIAEEETPPEVSATICEVDLTPLGAIRIPTSRLLLMKNMSLTKIDVSSHSALFEIVKTLKERGVPYLFSVITKQAGQSKPHDYLGVCRLVVFGTGNGITTNDEISRFANTVDPDFRLKSYFPSSSVIDNFDLPVEKHEQVARDTPYPQRVEEMDDMSARQTTIHDLKSGLPEYDELLSARMSPDDRYRELFDCYGVIRMQKRDLLNFHVAVPEFYEHSLFGACPTADSVRLITHDLGKPVDGTRQTYGTEESGDTERELKTDNQESDEHQETVSDWVVRLIRNGHVIVAIDQDDVDYEFKGDDPTENTIFENDSCPDIVSRKDGQLYFHEIEIHNDSNPAQLLTNLARGVHADVPVIVVTPNKKAAKNKFVHGTDDDRKGRVLEPYRDVFPNGVIPYNTDNTVNPTENITILLPSDVDKSRWGRTPSDIHQLRVNGTVVAEGPADKSVETYTYDLPRVKKQGSGYVVESSNGEIIREQPTKRAAIGDLTKVKQPFPITHWSYLSNVTVMYRSGDEFVEYEHTPEWAKPSQQKNSRLYEKAVHAFIEQMTVESEGDSIPMPTLRTKFLKWYQTLVDRPEPSETWFGRSVRSCSGDYTVDASDTHNKTLEDRRYIFSEELYSPDLPFITEDEDE